MAYYNEELYDACRAGDYEACCALLTDSIDIDHQYEDETLLYVASTYGHDRIVELLLDHGADPNALNNDLFTLAFNG